MNGAKSLNDYTAEMDTMDKKNTEDWTSVKFELKYASIHSREYIWTSCLQIGSHFVPILMC